MISLYARMLERLDRSDSVLVCCGGNYDRDTLHNLGFKDVVISNLSPHAGHQDYAPYLWERLDVERIDRVDCSVDWVVVHAGLHHCASPHQGLCEMLRVARKGCIVIEARDSALMRLAGRVGLIRDYELLPALISGGKWGGYRNGPIPNYVYRWTEREVEKTVATFLPAYKPSIEYFYGYSAPLKSIHSERSNARKVILISIKFALNLLKFTLPKQGNQFGFLVRKFESLHPWIAETESGLVANLSYISRQFDENKYKNLP